VTLLEEIAELLEELELGTYDPEGGGGDIFLAAMPDSPDLAIALNRQPGAESDALFSYDEPVVQVRIRGLSADPVAGETLAEAVYSALHGLGSRSLAGGSWLVLSIGTQGGPIYGGRDASGRDEWIVNLRMEIHRATANRR
jgi:Bacteriophage minor capsid protein